MKHQGILIGLCLLLLTCKNEPKSSETNKAATSDTSAPELVEAEETTADLFLTKEALKISDWNQVYFSNGNEVVLFRPSENDFGLLLEDTQDKTWLGVDDEFEALSNSLTANYSKNTVINITTVENRIIAIPTTKDTLFFDATKTHYGILLCKSDTLPEFVAHDAKNLIELIDLTYNWNE